MNREIPIERRTYFQRFESRALCKATHDQIAIGNHSNDIVAPLTKYWVIQEWWCASFLTSHTGKTPALSCFIFLAAENTVSFASIHSGFFDIRLETRLPPVGPPKFRAAAFLSPWSFSSPCCGCARASPDAIMSTVELRRFVSAFTYVVK